VKFYPGGNPERPNGPLCDGCHSVNYDAQSKMVTEWNVGCERCHGPGSEHLRQPSAATIVNPARLDFTRANDTGIQCHSQGQPPVNPMFGQYYDWPVGFHQGGNLRDYWQLEEHRLGETNFMHFADGTAHKNRMQGNDFVQSVMYRRGVTCFSCHDVHGTANNARHVEAGARDLLHLPQSRLDQRPAQRGHDRAAHPSRGRQRRQRLRGLPHAEDRADDRRRERPQPHLRVHHADDDRRVQDSEPLHRLPQGQIDLVGARSAARLDQRFALAH
jgi:hypothetical protein